MRHFEFRANNSSSIPGCACLAFKKKSELPVSECRRPPSSDLETRASRFTRGVQATGYALTYRRFGKKTPFVPNRPPNGQVDLARRPELADELVWWSRLVIDLATPRLQCTKLLILTYRALLSGLSHPHHVRLTVKVIRASFSQIRIAPRA